MSWLRKHISRNGSGGSQEASGRDLPEVRVSTPGTFMKWKGRELSGQGPAPDWEWTAGFAMALAVEPG